MGARLSRLSVFLPRFSLSSSHNIAFPGGQLPCEDQLTLGMEWESDLCTWWHHVSRAGSPSLLSFYPCQASRHFPLKLPLCLLGDSCPLHQSHVLSACKEFFIVSGGVHFLVWDLTLDLSFRFFYIFLGICYGRGSCSKVETVILWQQLVTF